VFLPTSRPAAAHAQGVRAAPRHESRARVRTVRAVPSSRHITFHVSGGCVNDADVRSGEWLCEVVPSAAAAPRLRAMTRERFVNTSTSLVARRTRQRSRGRESARMEAPSRVGAKASRRLRDPSRGRDRRRSREGQRRSPPPRGQTWRSRRRPPSKDETKVFAVLSS